MSKHIQLLDGVRGAMALWVFLGHLQIFITGTVPRFGHPASAVDVFMFLSGFLMVHQWVGRENKFNSRKEQSIDFYIRRFFRIAPLYYLALFIAIFWRNELSTVNPLETGPSALLAPVPFDFANLIAHLTFVFGGIPRYVQTNYLPDWSIGLEMQFYAAFPILLILVRKLGPLTMLGAVLFVGISFTSLFSLYDEAPKLLGNFPQPGLLFFKLHVFLGGMCVAMFFHTKDPKAWIWLLVGAISVIWQTSVQFKAIVFFLVYCLVLDQGKLELGHRIMSGRIAKFFGDTSYGVYLLHNIVLATTFMVVGHRDWFVALKPMLRAGIVLAIAGPLVYGIATVLYHAVEKPGIALGRKLAAQRSI